MCVFGGRESSRFTALNTPLVQPLLLYCYPPIPSTGGTVHMVCRNKDKAEEARADIVKESGNKVNEFGPLSHLQIVCVGDFLHCLDIINQSVIIM